jgi:hypothetical protein
MRLKKGVLLDGLTSQMALACVVIQSVCDDLSIEFVMTSGSDGKHSKGSLHYKGCAIDIRTRHIDVSRARTLAQRLIEALGENFDVVVERTHIHVEYDPADAPATAAKGKLWA